MSPLVRKVRDPTLPATSWNHKEGSPPCALGWSGPARPRRGVSRSQCKTQGSVRQAAAKNKPAGAEAGWRLRRRAGREPGLVTAVAMVLGGASVGGLWGGTDSSLNPQRLWEEEVSPGSDLWAAPPSATAPPSGWALVNSRSCFGFLGHKTA